MPKFKDIINPPSIQIIDDQEQLYRNLESINQFLDGLLTISNPPQTLNSGFATLSAQGMTPTTQADGDNFEFIGNWFVVGATQATYVLTPTQYPNNSPIVSGSPYFMNNVVSTYSGNGMYFYQRQAGMVRKFQEQFITLTLRANNNGLNTIRLRFDFNFFLNPSTVAYEGGALYLEPGYSEVTTTLKTASLRNQTVGSGNYVEFRLSFVDLPGGTANFDLYSIKGEFGKIGTPLS